MDTCTVYVAMDGPLRRLEKTAMNAWGRSEVLRDAVFGPVYANRAIPSPRAESERLPRKENVFHFVLVPRPSENATLSERGRVSGWTCVHGISDACFRRLRQLPHTVLMHDVAWTFASNTEQADRLLAAIGEALLAAPCNLKQTVASNFPSVLLRLRTSIRTRSPLVQRLDVMPLHEVTRRVELMPAPTFVELLKQCIPMLSRPIGVEHSLTERIIHAAYHCALELREDVGCGQSHLLIPVELLSDAEEAYVLQSAHTPSVTCAQLAQGLFVFLSEEQMRAIHASSSLGELCASCPAGLITDVSSGANRLSIKLLSRPPRSFSAPVAVRAPTDPTTGLIHSSLAGHVEPHAVFGVLLLLTQVHERRFACDALLQALRHTDRTSRSVGVLFGRQDARLGDTARPFSFADSVSEAWLHVHALPGITQPQAELAEAFSTYSSRMYVFHGCPGCGKSWILMQFARAFMQRATSGNFLVVYLAPTRMLRDEVTGLASIRGLFSDETELLLLRQAAGDSQDAPLDQWLERRMEAESDDLLGVLRTEETFFTALHPNTVSTSRLLARAKRHHDAAFAIYVRRWRTRRLPVFARLQFLAMTRTMGLECFAGHSPHRTLLEGRRVLLLCDELEDWSSVQLLSVVLHCDLLVAAGDADQTLRQVHRRTLHKFFSGSEQLMKPMQTEAGRTSSCERVFHALNFSSRI